MESMIHSLSSLFDQLGLDSSAGAIEQFISDHELVDGQSIYDAPFWNEAQKNFLKQALDCDADWAELADQLAVLLKAA